MNAAATQQTATPIQLAAEPAPAARGFGQLPCVQCGEPSACISLDLDDGVTFRCRECENEFTAEDVQSVIDRWASVLAWVRTMPLAPAE